jgi:Tfp pilus assembly protein PilF
MRWWSRVGLLLLLICVSPRAVYAQGDRSACRGGQAQRAYLEGVLSLSHQDYQTAVAHLEQAVQCAPTNTVYAKALALARHKLGETHP